MSEYGKSVERYAIAGASAIFATIGLKKVVERLKDTPERRSKAYKAVVHSIDNLLAAKQDEARDTDYALCLDLSLEDGLLSISRTYQEQPIYKIDSFRHFKHWGSEIHQHVFWETDGVTGTEKVFTAIPLADPSLNPIEPWEDHVTVDKEWTAMEAESLATKLTQWAKLTAD